MRKLGLWGLSLVVVVAVAGSFLAIPGRKVSAQTITLDRSLVALLPADATTLFGVNVERLKQTAAYQYIEETGRKQDSSRQTHLDDFAAITGFDPRRDVQELLVASWVPPSSVTAAGAAPSAAGSGTADNQFVAVAHGQFNTSGIQTALQQKGAATETYRGFQLFGPPPQQAETAKAAPRRLPRRNPNGRPIQPDDNQPAVRPLPQARRQGVFTFLDTNTALAGTRTAVLAAIDRKLGGGPNLLNNAALLSRAQTISASSQIWAVSQNPGDVVAHAIPQGAAGQNSNFARIFAGMQNTTFAVDLMNGLDLRAAGICKTADDAKTLADAARGLMALGRLSVSQQQPELMALFDALDVTQSNTELDIAMRLDASTLQKLLERTHAPKTSVVAFRPGK